MEQLVTDVLVSIQNTIKYSRAKHLKKNTATEEIKEDAKEGSEDEADIDIEDKQLTELMIGNIEQQMNYLKLKDVSLPLRKFKFDKFYSR